MPIGKFGEVIGTMNTFGDGMTVNIDSKVVAPKNPKLLRDKAAYVKLTPSEFMFQMSLDTQKKLQNTRTMELPEKVQLLDMADTTYQKTSQVSMEDPIFQPFPSTLFFVNCAPHETHEVPLLLRNNDKVPRLVKVTHDDSPYFKVIAPPNAGHKVAAGLPIVFRIQFTPDQRQDYQIDLIVVTEREKFVVPIHCIGARAILDFPDQVSFAATPIKHKETKTLFVRNIGNAAGNFTLSTNGPFTVEPNSAVLEINDCMQLDVHFCPEKCSNFDEELIIKFSTGESVYVRLIGAGQEVNVRMERSQVTVTETYVGLANLRQVRLHNRSSILTHFHWSSMPSEEAERLDRDACMQLLGVEELEELSRFQQQQEQDDDLCVDLLSSTDKSGLVSRSFMNRRKMLSDKKLRYEHEVFSIEPIEGVVWPNSSIDITVAFRPREARTYQSVAFCEITGRETRLSLKMHGIAIGPRVEFSFRTLDLGFIFVHSQHSYELVLANKGDIDALFRIESSGDLSPLTSSSSTSASRCFSFYPDDGLVSPGSHQAVQIRFHSSGFLGAFNEEFKVCLDGCLEPSIINFRGTVIGPTFNFSVPKIRFGKVSLGFASTEEIVLNNTSLVPIKYRLRIPDDGTGAPLLATDLDHDYNNQPQQQQISPRSHYYQHKPQQFTITPHEGVVKEMSSTNIQVTVTANQIGKINTVLIVDMIDVADAMHSLPISAIIQVPDITLSMDTLDFSRCFLRFGYERSIYLINNSELPVRYEMVTQTNDLDKVSYSSRTSKAIIEPKSQFEVYIEIKPLKIGYINTTIKFKIFGSDNEPLALFVKCVGEGPVVNMSPTSLDWGIIRVLEDKELIISLSNESEIPAIFNTNTIKQDSVFSVQPSSGTIERHETLDMRIIANVNDSVRFADELKLYIEDSKTKIIPLTATGNGTTIDFEPNITPSMDLGSHFSKSPFEAKFRVINKGRRHQQLVWSNEGYSYSKAIRQAAAVSNTFNASSSNNSNSSKNVIAAPLLTVHPHRFDLSPGESADLFIKGNSNIPQAVNERIVCHAIIGRQGGKELIKKVDLKITFISPVIEYSDKELQFRIDKDIYTEFEILRKTFNLRNVSGLPVNCIVTVSNPFNILTDEGDKVHNEKFYLVEEEEQTLVIEFNPLYKTDNYSRKIEDVMKVTFLQHPHTDEIKLIGEVNFPNITFDRTNIDFDCILNHSEVSQFVSMQNESPLPVKYSWTLLIGDKPNIIFHRHKEEDAVASAHDENELDDVIGGDEGDKDERGKYKEDDNEKEEDYDNKNKEREEYDEGEEDVNKDFNTEKFNLIESLNLNFSDGEEAEESKAATEFGKPKRTSIKSIRRDSVKATDEKVVINPKLKALLEEEKEIVTVGIEELFDVRPLFGTLNAGELEQITFTYFGHADIEARATAICEIEGGPSYKFELYGQASEVRYELSGLEFDLDHVRYDKVNFQELVIRNIGRVGFEFVGKDVVTKVPEKSHYPSGNVIMEPICGFVKSGEEVVVKIGYLAGIPGAFENHCRLQVAHFPMETIKVYGVATFPRVIFDHLPRDDVPDNEWTDEDGLLNLEDNSVAVQTRDQSFSQHHSKIIDRAGLPDKPTLPAYLLEFGNVILGDIISRVVTMRNNGSFPVTSKFIKNQMTQKGFSLKLHIIKSLPVEDEVQFEVKFDPRAANLSLGEVDSYLVINIYEGPLLPIRMKANVTMPDLRPSSDVIDFKQVNVGQALLWTVQLNNPTPVSTQWTTLTGSELDQLNIHNQQFESNSKSKQNQHKKRPQETKPPIFEMIPNTGELRPGQKLNVQIKFMPLEEKSYSHRLVMILTKSSKRVVIRCLGTGLDPSLTFQDKFVEFGPVLPFTNGSEKTISVTNPCNYPIEFYSLEFDKVYLEEEEILRHLSGYDKYGNLLIPPREPGEKLPHEFTDHYEKIRSGTDGEETVVINKSMEEVADIEMADHAPELLLNTKKNSVNHKSTLKSNTSHGQGNTINRTSGLSTTYDEDAPLGLDEYEQTPVSQAIARYLRLDLSTEGRAARRSRGIAVVVMGSPISGKSETANDLARRYSAALLTIDEIITTALSMRNTPEAQKAFDLCLGVTMRHTSLHMDEGGEKKSGEGGLAIFKRSAIGIAAAQGMIQSSHNRKTSTVSQMGAGGKHPSTAKQSTTKGIDHGTDKSTTEGSQYVVSSSSPVPFQGPPPATKLDIHVQVEDNTVELMSCVLPDDIIIQLISERLMLADCHKGVVLDGLESLFCRNMISAAQLVLHALNNRRFLYFVTMKRDLKELKEQEREMEEMEKLKEEEKDKQELIWIQEMTEQEYDELDEETRDRIETRIRQARLERKRRENEEKMRQQAELEAERQRNEREKLSKQKGGAKKGAQPAAPSVAGMVDDKAGLKGKGGKETSMGKTTRENTMINNNAKDGLSDKHTTDRPDSHMTDLSLEGEEKKKRGKIDKKSVGKIDEIPLDTVEEPVKDPKKEEEYLLHQKFKTFESEYRQIQEILAHWDRSHPPIKNLGGIGNMAEDEDIGQINAVGKKGSKGPVGGTGGRKTKAEHTLMTGGGAGLTVQASSTTGSTPNVDEEGATEQVNSAPEELPGIPNIVVDISHQSDTDRRELASNITEQQLPPPDEVLEGLGLGVKGPPIPPETLFNIIRFPVKRSLPQMPEMLGDTGHYIFLATEDEIDKLAREAADREEEEKSLDRVSITRSNRGGKTSSKDRQGGRKTSGKKSVVGNNRRGSQGHVLSTAPTPISDEDHNEDQSGPQPATTFRWIVQPNSTLELRLKFKSDELGQYDQILNFEILDTRRKYQVFCRGICEFPNISREPRTVFPNRKRNREPDEIVKKKYILEEELLDFGPLLIEKDKERVMSDHYLENVEEITIHNSSPLLVQVNFSFRDDTKFERFNLEPKSMTLEKDESRKLKIWAYPRAKGEFLDAIVCCIKENPEPVIFQIACSGVVPTLELDRKVLQFDKVLLHRKDMKTLYLRNPTKLPVLWELTGLESLGDEFSFSQDSGVIDPLDEFKLNAYFRTMKPYKPTQKKNIRIEVYDVDKIAGMLHQEPIQILAEAYDVALDMSFPKGGGSGGGLDMGFVKAGEEVHQVLTLKNRGPYEINFKFVLESPPGKPNVKNIFKLDPMEGKLLSGDKAIQVQITFCSKEEVAFKDEPLLKCCLIEPNVSDTGEEIANIPIRITAKAVFSKFIITPQTDINFGAIVIHSKKTRNIIIENVGEYDFKFWLTKTQMTTQKSGISIAGASSGGQLTNAANKDQMAAPGAAVPGAPPSFLPPKSKMNETALLGGSQGKLQVGNFILYPSVGSIAPKFSMTITVDCTADNPGHSDEQIMIEITDRNQKLYPQGVPYRLFVDAFIPGIDSENIAALFEEHRIVESLSMIHKDVSKICSGGVYGKQENRFMFPNALVGTKIEAHIRLDNPNKVPCDITLTLRPSHHSGTSGGGSRTGGRGSAGLGDIFEIEPNRSCIEPRSSLYASIYFSPQSMQQYTASLEVSIDGIPHGSPHRSKPLAFDIIGEGYLPRVSITKPRIRNKKGQPLCLFQRSLISKQQNQTIELHNDGSLPCRIHIDVIDPDNVFWVSADENDENKERVVSSIRQPHDLVLIMGVGEYKTISLHFQPTLAGKYISSLKVSVVNNQYEDTIVQMIGEAYEDFITFENLPPISEMKPNLLPQSTSAKSQGTASNKESSHSSKDNKLAPEAAKNNLLSFGDCFINQSRTVSFSLVNHSTDTSVRFQFPSATLTETTSTSVPVTFSPSLGHLHPEQSLVVMTTFNPGQTAKVWTDKPINCRITKIIFPELEVGRKPLNWDDSKKTMKWIDSVAENTTTANSASVRKKKVVETEPEPNFVETGEPGRTLDLLVSANVDYCRYQCKATELNFEDTMLFERRIYGFNLKNIGKVNLRYRWYIRTEELEVFTPRSSSRPSSARVYVNQGDAAREEEDEDLLNPFLVSPHEGVIRSGDKQTIEISFSPLSVKNNSASLMCEIDNLDPNQAPLVIRLNGRSQQPYCHIEMKDSDYLMDNRRDPTLRGPGGAPPGTGLDPATRVVEIFVIGIGSRDTKSFGIINPTKTPYTFQWICDDLPRLKCHPSIQCMEKSGVLEAGKKVEGSFKFISQIVGIVESFWTFEIEDLGIKIPFLIVGNCVEPSVTFNKSYFKFPSLLVGQESVESVDLINFDDQQYSFSFQDVTRFAPGHSSCIKIDPMSGTLPAKSKISIIIGFQASTNQKVNFNVLCQVDKKSYPLTLNVKAEGYCIESSLWIEDDQGHGQEIMPMKNRLGGAESLELGNQGNVSDEIVGGCLRFGVIELNEEQRRWITVVNEGQFDFEFDWKPRWSSDIDNIIVVEPVRGKVCVGGKIRCEFVLKGLKPTYLNHNIQLNIEHGLTYLMNIQGEIRKPVLNLSFNHYNFGHCFVYRAGMEPKKARLILENREGLRDLSVECADGGGSECAIVHDLTGCVLSAGGGKQIVTVEFVPRKVGKYNEKLEFIVNGSSRVSVSFVGVCEELRVAVLDLRGSTVVLGAVRCGDCIQKTLQLVNRSHATVQGRIAFSAASEALTKHGGLKISQLGQDISLEPGKSHTIPVQLTFNPTGRIPKFTEEVYLETMGISIPIFLVTGSCHGYDIQLDMNSISFGLVTKGSQLVRRLLLMNLGDIGAKFTWNSATFKPEFSITPTKGYISPGMKVPFDVTFHPTEPCRDVRNDKLQCSIEGWMNLPLTLTGVCQDVTPLKESVTFNATVRQTDVKTVKIHNPTNAIWTLRPIIVGEHWTGPETLIVESQQVRTYEITFRPLTMTLETKKHQGTLFFAISDGSGLLYNLVGTADSPKAVAKISRELPARTNYTEQLEVQGWLRRPQRFKVTREVLKPEKSDCGATLKGFDYIDVAASGKKMYKLGFVAQKEGTTQAKVTFTDEENGGEYLFYELMIRTTRQTSSALVKLSSPVRHNLQHTIMLDNPGKTETMFQITCTSTDIQCLNQMQVPPQSKLPLTLEFLPLKVGETQSRLEISSVEIGNSVYDLELSGTQPRPEKPLVFVTSLGTTQILLAKFKNLTKAKADFSCKIVDGNNKFYCDKSITVAPMVDAQLDVNFEPVKLGETRSTLVVSNTNAGEFVWPLIGTSNPPKPQGPFVIRAGGTVSITVHNFLLEQALFLFNVDNSAFHITKTSETIKSRRDYRVVVGFDGNNTMEGGPVMGKMVVTCPGEVGPEIQWVYYLRGVPRD